MYTCTVLLLYKLQFYALPENINKNLIHVHLQLLFFQLIYSSVLQHLKTSGTFCGRQLQMYQPHYNRFIYGTSWMDIEIFHSFVFFIQMLTVVTDTRKVKVKLFLCTSWSNMEGMELEFHSMVKLALYVNKRSASRNGRFTSTEYVHVSHWIGRWLGPTAGL